MNLIGYAGEKTGVPYPVLARASFGVWGANLAALVRAVVACFWYGAQTAAASGAVVALLIRNDGMLQFHKTHALPRPLGAGGDLLRGHLGAAVAHHPEGHGDGAQVPGLGRPGGVGRDADAGDRPVRQGRRLLVRPRHPDGRAARQDQGRRRQRRARLVLGADGGGRDLDHLLRGAVPELLRLLALREEQGGGEEGQPVGPAGQPDRVLAGRGHHHHRGLQGVRRSAAAPRADLGQVRQLGAGADRGAHLRGRHAGHQRGGQFRLGRRSTSPTCSREQISFKKGGYIAAAIALVLYPFAPWEGNAAHFVNAIGATMGPLLGIILVDYYLVAKGNINVAALYQEHGEYRYEGGWNVNALVAAGIGSVFSTFLPNFTNLLPAWWNTYGWFFGVLIGGGTYLIMATLRPRTAIATTRA